MKSVGFVTRVVREQGTGRELAAVYVPTTPNPTSGYLEIVPVELITPTDWTVDQAMSFIISGGARSEEHTSELQSLMRISYAVFCLQKKNKNKNQNDKTR